MNTGMSLGGTMEKELIIIGGGVVGCALARELSAYAADIALVERGHDVAEGASKANSGIVHAGFDAKPGSLKAELNVEGAKLYPALSQELGVPYGQPGALVIALEEAGRETIRRLYEQGVQSGVEGLKILEGAEALALEPNLSPEVVCALHAKTSGLTSPYEMTYALADHAAVNSVEFWLDTDVESIQRSGDGFVLETSRGALRAKRVVNCAGMDAARLHNMLSDETLRVTPRKGEYYLLDRVRPLPFTRTIFQTPTRMGKGVLVSPTVHGNLLLGPSAQDVEDGAGVGTSAEALRQVADKSKLTWPEGNLRQVITTFSGIRAHVEEDDFIVGRVAGAKGAYEAVGIESPGLSAAPAIARRLCREIVEDAGLVKKKEWRPPMAHEKPFAGMTLEERDAAFQKDASYGGIVCRCEQVTEAEIRAAIRRPVGARSIDGVKRRTRAGMGRCQGGFCSPRVLEILAEELGLDPMDVTKCGGKSVLLTGVIGAGKEGK